MDKLIFARPIFDPLVTYFHPFQCKGAWIGWLCNSEAIFNLMKSCAQDIQRLRNSEATGGLESTAKKRSLQTNLLSSVIEERVHTITHNNTT
eukprot:3686214-Amphidinium_carterae.1